jgi:DNA-directed RNA polymerase specialized sigma24 family protein
VCTRSETSPSSQPTLAGGIWVRAQREPLADVAAVAQARRERLLRVHAFRLRREDLEDCYSQATLELMIHVRRGGTFSSTRHIANALEQRFLSRIQDRRRAVSGRSPIQAAIEGAHAIGTGEGAVDVADLRSQPEQLVIARAELRRIAELSELLTPDQRLVLATQLAGMPRGAFCARFGWSVEKYRKVGQRARARLRRLMTDGPAGVPGAPGASEKQARRPMRTPPPPHGPGATAARARTAQRAHGERRPRASGRAPEPPPRPDPAARVAEGLP